MLSVSPTSCFLGCICVHCSIDSDSQVLKVQYVDALEYQNRRNCIENYEIAGRQKHKKSYCEVCVSKNLELLNESKNHKVQLRLEVSEEIPVFTEPVPCKYVCTTSSSLILVRGPGERPCTSFHPHPHKEPYRNNANRKQRSRQGCDCGDKSQATKVKISSVCQFEKDHAALGTQAGAPSGKNPNEETSPAAFMRLFERSGGLKHPVRSRNSKSEPEVQGEAQRGPT